MKIERLDDVRDGKDVWVRRGGVETSRAAPQPGNSVRLSATVKCFPGWWRANTVASGVSPNGSEFHFEDNATEEFALDDCRV